MGSAYPQIPNPKSQDEERITCPTHKAGRPRTFLLLSRRVFSSERNLQGRSKFGEPFCMNVRPPRRLPSPSIARPSARLSLSLTHDIRVFSQPLPAPPSCSSRGRRPSSSCSSSSSSPGCKPTPPTPQPHPTTKTTTPMAATRGKPPLWEGTFIHPSIHSFISSFVMNQFIPGVTIPLKVPESRHRRRRGQDSLHQGGALSGRRSARLVLRHRSHGN